MTKAEKKEIREMVVGAVEETIKTMEKAGRLGVKVVERRVVDSSGSGGNSGCQY